MQAMKRSLRGTTAATAALGVLALFSGALMAHQTLGNGTESARLASLEQLVLAMLVANWLYSYRRASGGPRLLDEGFFCVLCGLLMIPIYVVAARGRSALLRGLIPIGMYLLCAFVGGTVYFLCMLAIE